MYRLLRQEGLSERASLLERWLLNHCQAVQSSGYGHITLIYAVRLDALALICRAAGFRTAGRWFYLPGAFSE